MNFDPDISSDLLLVDGVETVTLAGSRSVTVAGAKRGQLTTAQQSAATGVSEPTEIVWLLPADNLDGITPRPGDHITDSASIGWTIATVSFSPLSQVWRAGCRRQR
ncbi:MAG TPA: hypothetical protein VMF30_17995 [Pirellulales bacterium]|nr:hypothetical protein [Pirellulales bacterium]